MVNRCAKRRMFSCAGARVRQVPHGCPKGEHYINNILFYLLQVLQVLQLSLKRKIKEKYNLPKFHTFVYENDIEVLVLKKSSHTLKNQILRILNEVS
jgi:hypothetical protein